MSNKTKSEIIRDLPFEAYRRWPGINNSSLHELDADRRDAGCPARYHWAHVLGNREDIASDALSFGRAFHSYVLTPTAFEAEFAVENEALYADILAKAQRQQEEQKRKPSTKFSKSLTAWKEYKAEIQEEGKELVDAGAFERIKAMDQMIRNPAKTLDPKVAAIFKRPEGDALEAEVSILAQLDDGRGNLLDCKARLDAFDKTANTIYDLKSIAEWDPGGAIWKWGWWIQAAFYADIAMASGLADKGCKFGWIFSRKAPPYEAALHMAEADLLKAGRITYRQHLQTIHDCRQSGHWPGHAPVTYPYGLNQILDAMA